MKHPERVEDYLEHILEAIARAMSYVEPMPTLEAFEKNPQAQDAVIRNIEIIGEAARNIEKQSPHFVKAHPGIPWSAMQGIRHKVIHHYFDVELPVVWSTVKDDLPKLKQQVNALLADLRLNPNRER
jgi:uncharacterized protein with HEPN domain